MPDIRETIVHSIDDPWLDEQTIWSLAEMNAVTDIIEAVNSSHLSFGQGYHLLMNGTDDNPHSTGSITLIANAETGPDAGCLQHLADGICRLIRPSRYAAPEGEDGDAEIWSQSFVTPHISAHDRLQCSILIPRLAAGIGRTDFGIEAALAELRGWADGPALAMPA